MKKITNISIACDHAGFELKKNILKYLKDKKFVVKDFGTFSIDSVDYPEFAHKVADNVEKGISDIGILICGSGQGMAMAANKHKNIRAALCWNVEIAKLSRAHNNANILTLPGRFLTPKDAINIVEIFINTDFEGGRHARRIKKI